MDPASQTPTAGLVSVWAARLRRRAGWLLPLGALLLARGLLAGAASHSEVDLSSDDRWVRWDAYHYLSIAREGYSLVPCNQQSGWSASEHCGTAGWFPLYPGAIRALTYLGLEAVPAALLLSLIFELGALLLLWRFLLGGRHDSRSVGTLLLFALFPGLVYRHAVFPVSAFLFFVVATLAALHHRRFRLAALPAFLAGLTHSAATPLFLVWALAGWLLEPGASRALRVKRSAGLAVSAGLGIATANGIIGAMTGTWNAHRLVQDKYRFQLLEPLQTAARWLEVSFGEGPRSHPSVGYQLLFMLGLVALLLFVLFRALRRREADAPWLLVIATLVLGLWSIPYLFGKPISIYRVDAFCAPAALILGRLPGPVLWLLVAAAGALGFWLGAAYFLTIIV